MNAHEIKLIRQGISKELNTGDQELIFHLSIQNWNWYKVGDKIINGKTDDYSVEICYGCDPIIWGRQNGQIAYSDHGMRRTLDEAKEFAISKLKELFNIDVIFSPGIYSHFTEETWLQGNAEYLYLQNDLKA